MNKLDEKTEVAEGATTEAQSETNLFTVGKLAGKSAADVRGGKPSASGLQRLALCPGSWQAEAKCPPSGDSADSAMGTWLHKCMETGDMPEDAEEREACEWCKATEVEFAKTLLGGVETAHCREARWWDKGGKFSGQADVVYYNAETGDVLICDYKFGRGEVAPTAHNHQLAALALLAVDNLPSVRKIYVCILQPFVSRKPEPRLWDASQADALRAGIYGIIADAEVPQAPLTPGEKQCKYCRALATCPAVSLQLRTASALDITEANWGALTPMQKAQAYELASLAKRWAARVDELVKTDLKAGTPVDGLTLGNPRKTFRVENAAGAFAKLNSLYPEITAEVYTKCCSVSLSKLDPIVHKLRKAEGTSRNDKQSKEWLRSTLKEFGGYLLSEPSIEKIKPTEDHE